MTFLLLTINVLLGGISRLDVRQKAHLLLLLLPTKFLLQIHMSITIQIINWAFLTGFIELFDVLGLLWGLDVLMVLDTTAVLVEISTYTSFVDLVFASHRHTLIKLISRHLELAYHSIVLLNGIPTLLNIFEFTIGQVSLDVLHGNSILRLDSSSRLRRLLLMLLWHLSNEFRLPHGLGVIFILTFRPFGNKLAIELFVLLGLLKTYSTGLRLFILSATI